MARREKSVTFISEENGKCVFDGFGGKWCAPAPQYSAPVYGYKGFWSAHLCASEN